MSNVVSRSGRASYATIPGRAPKVTGVHIVWVLYVALAPVGRVGLVSSFLQKEIGIMLVLSRFEVTRWPILCYDMRLVWLLLGWKRIDPILL